MCVILSIMLERFSQFASTSVGGFLVLALAAYLEAQGDACFQSGLYKSSALNRVGFFAAGTVVLVFYSLFLNSAKIDFGKLLGIYVVFFFWVAQLLAKVQFDQALTKPVCVGGIFITVGGLIMTLWRG